MNLRLCGLLLAAGLTLLAQTPERQDAVARDQVSMKLAMDRDVRGNGIQVTVKDGVATLEGRVNNAKAREKATKLAKKVKNVKSVENRLKLPDEK
jgi:hyperosmotically inducible periplasmic protein